MQEKYTLNGYVGSAGLHQWKSKQAAIDAEANRKRSEAMEGNDNAAKDRDEKTVVQQSVGTLNEQKTETGPDGELVERKGGVEHHIYNKNKSLAAKAEAAGVDMGPMDHEEEYAKQQQEKSQFKEGNAQSSLGGLAKAGKLPVTQNSGEPANAKRDIKKKHVNSTAGKLAAQAGGGQ